MTEDLERDGYLWLRDAVPQAELADLRALAQTDSRPGARVPVGAPLFRQVVSGDWLGPVMASRPDLRPVRLVSFAKGEASNWSVPWHQDRVIAVAERDDAAPVTNWSRKDGIWHCEPDVGTLSAMLFVRLHLNCHTAENGAMEIAVGSHRQGPIAGQEAEAQAALHPRHVCTAEPGDILVMSMLLLHRSGTARTPAPRGVLRIDYADTPPPPPLCWQTD
ncbi:phytanoyl-CoA dioxygenase family protein [Jannaschia pohangensis]|uniref:Phytanoyl-CoA dioxygenase (PhyH) n=1 Tax=Jannaschia pohangensis TaxID=390807 RepID=A0A1I3Q0C6_9RHOB|nr:phytanoyl-CoA dioxygenase family protein [Jannaschia pohangensis]SFJ27145.1 Phytanoyl-CoA dioxygenase (PhyH) [Jannaschia pohangensis]